MVSLNFQYTKVNPTFHHWAVDDKRFGLTFEASSDASAFEKTITRVVENLKLIGKFIMKSILCIQEIDQLLISIC